MWSLVTDCFNIMCWGFIDIIASISTCFLLPNNIPLYTYTSVYLFIRHRMDICVVYTFWLSWIMLIWTFLYKFLCGYTFVSLEYIIPRSKIHHFIIKTSNMQRSWENFIVSTLSAPTELLPFPFHHPPFITYLPGYLSLQPSFKWPYFKIYFKASSISSLLPKSFSTYVIK